MVFKIIRSGFEFSQTGRIKNFQIFELKFGYLKIFLYICSINLKVNIMTKELLEQEFKNGLWHKDIAEKYSVTPRTIYEYVKKWDLHIPRKNTSQKTDPTQKCKRCGKLFYKLEDGYCGNCKEFLEKHKRDLQEIVTTNSELGKQIQELRKQGLSYTQIQLQLGCSKSSISYHCNQQTKDKTKIRTKKEIYKK